MNRTISWPDKSLAAEICCVAGVLQELEMAAVDGLLAMPRTGLGIGGLLLGKQYDRRIEVLRVLAIPCSHATGPAFVLTAEEMDAAAWQGREAGCHPGAELVGCYWSKPNGLFALTEYDHALFEALCPEPWQVALVIRPSLGSVTMAAFGFRGNSDRLRLGVPRELVREGLARGEQAADEERETSAIVAAEAPAQAEVVTVQAQRAKGAPAAADVVREETFEKPTLDLVIPVAMPLSGTLFGVPERAREADRQKGWPRVPLALAVLLAILATSAFFTRDSWLPRWRSAVRTYLPDSGISK